ncbi:hypothetical protein BDFB_013391, partial [Asbolus verrucosus]
SGSYDLECDIWISYDLLSFYCMKFNCKSLHWERLGASVNDIIRPHTSAIIREFHECVQINLLPWASRSPHLLPVEHVWDPIGVKIGNLQLPLNNLVELGPRIQEAWDEIPQLDIDNLISSMIPRVVESERSIYRVFI